MADEIRSLRDRTMIELVAAYDYFSDSEQAWRLIQESIDAGQTIIFRTLTTGTMTTPGELLDKSRRYVAVQLTEATFQQFLSIFESFYLDLLTLWLTAFPQSLGKKMVDFKSVLDLPDKDAIIQLVVRKELNEVLYDRPEGWFAFLEDRAKLGCPSTDEVARVVEAKATRDLLAHNKGGVNKTYLLKTGNLARFPEGERIEVSKRYHRETWDLLQKVVADVADAAIAKV